MNEKITSIKIKIDKSTPFGIVKVLEDGSTVPLSGNTDWKYLSEMTDEQIEAAAKSDPDNPPITPKELKGFKRVGRRSDKSINDNDF